MPRSVRRLTCKEQRVFHRTCQLLLSVDAADGDVAVSARGDRIGLPVVSLERFQFSFERSLCSLEEA